MATTTSSTNSLGLDFDQLAITEQGSDQVADVDAPPVEDRQTPNAGSMQTREKKKPYVNLERVKTGGAQRDKLSEEALTERMARMREQNEKIKQRRLDVQADEDAFRKTQEAERAKLAQIRKVQENVDRTREQNAKRKMDKIQSREWDSGKPTGDWKHQAKKADIVSNPSSIEAKLSSPPDNSASSESRGWTRGGHLQRGRGRGRGGSQGSSRREAETIQDVISLAHENEVSSTPPSEPTKPTSIETSQETT